MYHTIVAVTFAGCFLSAPVLAQDNRPTIPELAARQAPNPVIQGRTSEPMPKTLEQLASLSELVIHGTIKSARAYLSKDQRDLYTDYVIHPSAVFLQTAVKGSPTPGVIPDVVVRRWGGTTMISNVKVIAEDATVRSFKVGEELLLCLTYDAVSGKYELAGGTGAFSVRSGALDPFVKHPNTERMNGMAMQMFVEEMRALRR